METIAVGRRPDGGEDRYLPVHQPTDVLLIERLLNTAPHPLSLDAVTRIINRARDDLAGAPPGALPELLERLVRQRLG